MHHTIKRSSVAPGGLKQVFKETPVGDVSRDEINAFGKQIATAVAEVIDYNSPVAALKKEACDRTSDVTGAAGDQNVHKNLPELRTKIG
jgi:hypothetical protein